MRKYLAGGERLYRIDLRDKVAGKVLVRLLPDGGWGIYPQPQEIEGVSKLAYAFADAMIAARDA